MGSSSKTAHHSYTIAPTHPPVTATVDSGAVDTLDELSAFSAEAITPPSGPASETEEVSPIGGANEGTPSDPADQETSLDVPEVAAVAGPEGGSVGDGPGPDGVIPIPHTPPEGAPAGAPVLIGGADLQDSTATLVSYRSPDGEGPREVLLTTVSEDAEAKLLDALALSETKMVPVQVEEQVTAQLPLDQDKKLYEACATAAKSINHKLKNDYEKMPDHTIGYLNTAKSAVQAVLDDPTSSPSERSMATAYKAWLDQMQERVDAPHAVAYNDGGKIPKLDPYQETTTQQVTKMVPAPTDHPEEGKLTATMRGATRIQPTLDTEDGSATWDGAARSTAHGKEYVIDLGDGYSAVYRPYSANDPTQHEYSLRGQLEVHAPQGAGHGRDLVTRLGDLHLVNRGMDHREAEWTYLVNNINAQSLEKTPAVSQALATAQHLEDFRLQEIFHDKAHEAVGKDATGLAAMAKEWQIEAAASSLPQKVRLVREAVAQATGFSDGHALRQSPGYDPVPRAAGGWLTWGRFDIGNHQKEHAAAWKGKSLMHQVSGHNLVGLLSTGVLASTERRAVMGVGSGHGMSELDDKESGGASSVFMRVRDTHSVDDGETRLVWDDPLRIIDNTSLYGYPTDQYGAINPHSIEYHSSLTKDPKEISEFTYINNEVMIRNGLDLFDRHAPSRILCGSITRKKVLSLFAARGITHLGGKPVDQVVIETK